MIYNVVMSPLRGFGSWWALWFVGVNPYAVLCSPFGAWGRYLICGDSQISAEHYSVSITFSLQSYYFFFEYANFVRTNCIFLPYSCGFAGSSMWMVAFYVYL